MPEGFFIGTALLAAGFFSLEGFGASELEDLGSAGTDSAIPASTARDPNTGQPSESTEVVGFKVRFGGEASTEAVGFKLRFLGEVAFEVDGAAAILSTLIFFSSSSKAALSLAVSLPDASKYRCFESLIRLR